MNEPKRWIETESGSTPLERALLRPGLDVEVPDGVEQRIWSALVVAAPAAAATATAGKAAAGSAALATTQVGLTMVMKAFAIGVLGGLVVAGGVTALQSPSEQSEPVAPKSRKAIAQPLQPERPTLAPTASVRALEPVLPSADPAPQKPAEPEIKSPTAPHSGALPALPAESEDVRAPRSRLAEEARILVEARQALRAGDLTRASAAIERARTEFARGALGEEREALTIELLAKSGQRAAARTRAEVFLRSFPNSPHAANVRALGF